jgi:gamma-glutamyltranspeptidase/glutathione hydrolase
VSMYNKSIVASGHKKVSEAAAEILSAGGNAFDAIVAAGFASAVVEPALTSLGGGGMLVGHREDRGEDFFFDFFVDTPGRGLQSDGLPDDFFAITVDFSGSTQEFHIGLGSVAVPGTLKGLMHTQRRLGRMPIGEVLVPAMELAASHTINEQQGHFLKLLNPIMTYTAAGRNIYQPDGRNLKRSDTLSNDRLVSFLQLLAQEGEESFYRGEIAQKIGNDMAEQGGLLTHEDLANYKVVEKKPLTVPYRGGKLVTAPEPSMGGPLIGLSIALMAGLKPDRFTWGSGEHLVSMTGLMTEVERLREAGVTTPAALVDFIRDKKNYGNSCDRIRLFSRGTTHVSIADKDGNCASMTCSNGEGSGYFAPETGVMLNNMMGEDDLHPGGFHSSPSGQRVYSMMSPSLYLEDDRVRLVLGSGGSKRIRIAVSQVLSQVVDFGRPLQEAVDAPRLYLDEGLLQLEPGFSEGAVEVLEKVISVNRWKQKDVYFGGVHAVVPGVEGAGDPRRGGAVAIITHS